ncbi:MAG TPA: hypothetical protein VM140_04685 [Burkholderiales bacterium]|nr:hypothetical protein [Burkholderiales bacterium]
MAGQLRSVVFLLVLACTQAAAQVDPNYQALLNALMRGSEAAMLTPLPDGTVEITSFIAPGQRSAVDAATLIERARLNLANFGIEQPSGRQLALALSGGTIDVPSGSTQIPGVLPQGTAGMRTRSQIVAAGTLPTIVAASPAGVGAGQAAAGGSAPRSAATTPNGGLAGLTPAQQTQALQLAHSQLAALGISNPTPQQVAAAVNGGNVVTPGGTSMLLPGLFPGQAPLSNR